MEVVVLVRNGGSLVAHEIIVVQNAVFDSTAGEERCIRMDNMVRKSGVGGNRLLSLVIGQSDVVYVITGAETEVIGNSEKSSARGYFEICTIPSGNVRHRCGVHGLPMRGITKEFFFNKNVNPVSLGPEYQNVKKWFLWMDI